MNYLKNIFGHTKWSASASVFTVLLQAALYLVITRFITTEELGVFALSSSFVFIGITIIENSFPSSLIHRNKLRQEDFQAVFTLNLSLATFLLVTILVFSLAFDLTFGKTRIMHLVLCLSPILYLSSINSIRIAALKIKMQFRTLATIEVISIIIYFSFAVLLSFFGFGYWSLIVALVMRHLGLFFLLFSINRNYSLRVISHKTPVFKEHLDYGKYIVGEKGLSALFSYADVFLVNHFIGLHTLGVYDVLKKMVVRPLILLYNSIEQVLFPLLAKSNYAEEPYNRAYSGFMDLITLIYLPLTSLIFINRHFLLGFFPEAYSSNVALAGMIILWSISIILINPLDIIMYSINKTRNFFYWFVGSNILLLIIMIYFVRINIESFVSGITLFNLSLLPISYLLLISKNTSLNIRTYFGFSIWIIPLFILIILMENHLDEMVYLSISNSLVLLLTGFFLFRYRKNILK
ncbi:MAG: oligosaccharide flippase family protein [Bacteroidia bacterium]|nr:oligosaccharide flippase family protein [Bacteroidia bacterium]